MAFSLILIPRLLSLQAVTAIAKSAPVQEDSLPLLQQDSQPLARHQRETIADNAAVARAVSLLLLSLSR
jgi:hypothetical protein